MGLIAKTALQPLWKSTRQNARTTLRVVVFHTAQVLVFSLLSTSFGAGP